MNSEELRALQAPLKKTYRDQPEQAQITLRAVGKLDLDRIACRLENPGHRVAGLHPAVGGDGSFACSGEIFLESLVSCAGVTLCAVATAMGIPLGDGRVVAEGDWDARGTLGVDRSAPVGLTAIRLRFELDTTAEAEQIAKLVSLTERYCVVFQTLTHPPMVSVSG